MVEIFTDTSPIHGKGVFTTGVIVEGGYIGTFIGHEIETHSQHSLTLNGIKIHPTGMLKYLNHSCDPNSRFVDDKLFAIRDIEPREEISISYTDTEGEIKYPCKCNCGSSTCKSWLRVGSGS
jgi:hypothetical protein